MNLFDPAFLSFSLSSLLMLISAILIVWHRSIVYSAFFLSMLGVGNAVLFAMLGFPIIALFHLAVYVGAAVTFILFSVVMLREAPTVEVPTKLLAILSSVLLAVIMINIFSVFNVQPAYTLNYRDLTSLLVDKYWFALIVAALALVTTLIEAITLARKEV
ncbi:MAG: hypothetical protein DRN78_03230 [Thermoproteota archaeon]|nr:NADH-quinone oxidoreductase subunit J [Candidatus Korarchaeota archaeon]RLG42388.1 MAG: hypothetical protein DRN78_03230 [Candidatus Korarchaeota archaeon]